jgi:HAD superfamily hydrolase (TIGR01549 family)
MADTAIFDVDGTLVDTNYQHALAWFRALRRFDITVPVWRIHRHIGMGGDQLLPAVAGDEVEDRLGDEVRHWWAEEYGPMLAEVQPFEGAVELLTEVKRRGFKLALASSGKAEHLNHYLDLVDGRRLADGWTTSADVEKTKPAPDVIRAAMDKVEANSGVMIGDSTWDFLAARKLGLDCLAIRTGGFSPEELRDAGATGVYESLPALLCDLSHTALDRPTR